MVQNDTCLHRATPAENIFDKSDDDDALLFFVAPNLLLAEKAAFASR